MPLSSWKFFEHNINELVEKYLNSEYARNNQSIHFISAHAVVEGYESEKLNEIFSKGELICDSKPLSLYLKLKTKKLVQIRGADFMRLFLENSPRNSKHFFLGGNEGVKKGLLDFIAILDRVDLEMSFEMPPYVENWQEYLEGWKEKIDIFKPNYIWVGLGAPKQFYVSDEISRITDTLTFSVGAAFDFVSKYKKESPKIFTVFGLEWLFRLCTEPSRLWKRYLWGNVKFIAILISERKSK
jgi:N-acetylglucosaminyldiphosphoundecaprenol N-acetyl-beta-D-mannosaminyltransferase